MTLNLTHIETHTHIYTYAHTHIYTYTQVERKEDTKRQKAQRGGIK